MFNVQINSIFSRCAVMVLMAVTALSLCASLPRGDTLFDQVAQMTAGTWTAPIGPDGLLSSVSASPAFTFDRDDEGRVTDVKRNGALAYQYEYDDAGLLAKDTDSTSTLGGSAVITHDNDAYVLLTLLTPYVLSN